MDSFSWQVFFFTGGLFLGRTSRLGEGRLVGVDGLAGIFITSIYTGVEKYKSCIFPHPYIGSLENRCQPVNPSRLGWIWGGLAVLKRKCVLPETQGRLD